MSLRLVRNLSGNVFRQVPHSGIPLFDKRYLAMSVHILYLFFPDDCTADIFAYLIIYKLMQKMISSKAIRIQVVLCSYVLLIRSFIIPTYRVGLALAIIYTAKLFSLTQPSYQKDSGQAGMTEYEEHFQGRITVSYSSHIELRIKIAKLLQIFQCFYERLCLFQTLVIFAFRV